MRPTLEDLSVIIPVASGDESWKEIVSDLKLLPMKTEILFVSVGVPKDAPTFMAKALATGCSVKWLTGPSGRAKLLNFGARNATHSYLWFLHADSKLKSGCLMGLERAMQRNPDGLYYFDLEFLKDGPKAMRVNTVGVWIRSHLLKMPFGDQGFCISRRNYERLGGFDEKAPYGEDHLFVWAARRFGINLVCTQAKISTSSRKYRDHGWLPTTSRHLYLTAKQAIPESIQLIRWKIFGKCN